MLNFDEVIKFLLSQWNTFDHVTSYLLQKSSKIQSKMGRIDSQTREIKKMSLDDTCKCLSNWALYGCPTLIVKEIFSKRGHVTKPASFKIPYFSSPCR